MRMVRWGILVAVLAGGCVGQNAAPPPPSSPPPDVAGGPAASNATAPSPGSNLVAPSPTKAPSADAQWLTLATDRTLMRALEDQGASLASLLEDQPTAVDNARLATLPRYASMLRVFDEDARAAAAVDPNLAVGMSKAHRLIDTNMLRSAKARFELVGVSVRMDREHVRAGTCGEGRFVYRLAYATERNKVAIASRLPVTLAYTFYLGDGEKDCRAVAARTRYEGALAAPWLLAATGPFGGLAAIKTRFKQMESNLQNVRWPSTTRGDLGGHAEYVLRVFAPAADGRSLRAGALENTPDVTAITKDPAKRTALAKWVRDNVERIEAGTAILPNELAATKSVSVSPRGLARFANRPFRQLLEPGTFADVAPTLERTTHVRSPEALVRRLDELSCAGCHQTRSVAGFHVLGEDATRGANSIAVPMSPHALSELERRRTIAARIAEGQPIPAHPPAERAPEEAGTFGAHCGLGDPGFARWTCAEGFTCVRGDRAKGEDNLVGTCLPKTPAVGAPCEHAVIARDANPARDRATIERAACGGGAVCDTNHVGFPGGMCATSCASAGPDGICAGIPILTSFNACLARSEPFESCIAANTNPAGVRACDASTPCREDYICAASSDPKRGACMPPYFLFQLRVDGHPTL